MTEPADDGRGGAPGPAMAPAAITCPAVPRSVAELRAHVRRFAEAHGADPTAVGAMLLATSEAATNAVVHAFVDREPGTITVACSSSPGELQVEVADDGRGLKLRDDSPGLGMGLSTIGSLASRMEVRPNPAGAGTVLALGFRVPGAPGADHVAGAGAAGAGLLLAAGELALGAVWPQEGFERLCELVLDGWADAACVDVVERGVLRRLAAVVHGDPVLTERLGRGTPPMKPGTATWAALHGEGPQLVVHDPTVARSPGGPGAMLDLRWWLAVPLGAAGREPVALWGLGGRAGRPPPDPEVVALMAEAALRAAGGLTAGSALAGAHGTRRRLQATLGALEEAVVVRDASGATRYANPAARGRSRPAAEAVRVVDPVTGATRWGRTHAVTLPGDGAVTLEVTADVTGQERAAQARRALTRAAALLDVSPLPASAVQGVAEALAAELADGCALDGLRPDGTLQRLAVAHPDPGQAARLRAWHDGWPATADPRAWAALSGGAPLLIGRVTDEVRRALAHDPEHLALLRAGAFGSLLSVALRAAGRAVGALTLVHDATSGRAFDHADAELAVALGQQLGTALALHDADGTAPSA